MEKVWATNYLVVENVQRYRLIMRYFYKRHRQMQGTLYRPDVLEMMRQEYSPAYTEIEVDQDLENLVTWGNLQKQQEMIRPKSIEEYRNKNLRYQITEAGILVEEMVYQLTNQKHAARGALDEKGVRKLLQLLQDLVKGEADIVDLWPQVREEFRKVGEDTANYIGYITSPEVDSQMKTEQFLVYKDQFVNYLRDFISALQSLYHQFLVVIEKIDSLNIEKLIDGMYQKELEIPMMDYISREEVEEQVLGQLQALKIWFKGREGRPSEYTNLMMQTDQMITKITGLIYYFGQEIHQYQSRKKDYIHLAKWFAQAKSLEDAQKMYSGIFGLERTRHYCVSEGSDATSMRDNSWQLKPGTLFMRKRGKNARIERKAKSFVLNMAEQQKQLAQYRQEITAHRQQIEQYFHEGTVDFSKIKQLDAASRKVFLKWISQAVATHVPKGVANQTKQQITQKIVTELDFEVEVHVDLNTRIQVACEDGIIEMPQVMIERRGNE